MTSTTDTPLPLLGGLSPSTFLARHWQKKPLLVRQAIPGFTGFVDTADLFRLAQRRDVVARLVSNSGSRQTPRPVVSHGPFPKHSFQDPKSIPGPWSLLIQGIEGLHPEGWPLLEAFDFLPRTRLDDLMISVASIDGGIGAHVDRYDVFLLQGAGTRRWRIAEGGPRALDTKSALPVLKDFRPEQTFELEPGDMLYLPPGVAHEGVALSGPCFTYSIGAIAPAQEGLLQNFLAWQSQEVAAVVDLDTMYEDPDLKVPDDVYAVDDTMVLKATAMLERLRFDADTVGTFLGRLLTGPKPHVRFQPPQNPRDDDAFRTVVTTPNAGRTLSLALPSRGLVRGTRFFLNGEVAVVDGKDAPILAELLRRRSITLPLPRHSSPALLKAFAHWTRLGFLTVSGAKDGGGGPQNRAGAEPNQRRKPRRR